MHRINMVQNMKNKHCIIIGLMLVVGCGYCDSLTTMPRIHILCDSGVCSDGYSRLSTNIVTANFSYEITQLPVPREEWDVSDPEVTWSLSPNSVFAVLLPNFSGATLFLADTNFFSDKGYGDSYTIKATVAWTLINQETGEQEKKSCSATYTIDAVIYSFSMSCSDGAHSITGESLVDNHPARVIVTAKGCTRPHLLGLSLASHTTADGVPLNKKGTSMTFMKRNHLEFDVPKTYWYGLAKPHCCHKMRFPYEVLLSESSDGLVATKQVFVGWPSEHPEAAVEVTFPPYQKQIIAEGDGFKASISLFDFVRTPHILDAQNITDQYREETISEENYHRLQFLGSVPWSEGGEPDIYAVGKVREHLRFNPDAQTNVFYSLPGETREAFDERIQSCVDFALIEERAVSEKVFDANLWFREKKAKDFAGYNAAWTYHCTYEDELHLESNIPHVTRKEIEAVQ